MIGGHPNPDGILRVNSREEAFLDRLSEVPERQKANAETQNAQLDDLSGSKSPSNSFSLAPNVVSFIDSDSLPDASNVGSTSTKHIDGPTVDLSSSTANLNSLGGQAEGNLFFNDGNRLNIRRYSNCRSQSIRKSRRKVDWTAFHRREGSRKSSC